MKKKFTLIELIAVITILGILAAMIIPNISSFQGEATETAIKADAKNLQTSADMYQLDHYGNFPSEVQPEVGEPQPIKFDLLYPKYLREIPKHDGVYYWIDYTGKVWVSPFDSPINVVNNGTVINWSEVNGADYYNVFEIISSTTSAVNNPNKLKYLGSVTTTSYNESISSTKTYLVNAVDNEGFESAPVGTKYAGYTLESSTNTESGSTVNQAPTAIITMTPEQALTTATTITWEYSASTDADGDSIVNAEWKGKQDIYTIAGTYTVELRVQDDKGNWSDWVSKTFYVVGASTFTQIVAGTSHTAAIMKDGTVQTWGYNAYGQLGNGTTINSSEPVTVQGLSNVKQIAIGGLHTLALLNDGTVKAWGSNSYGQLGDGTKVDKLTPTTISGLTNVIQIGVGASHSMALINDGTVKTWGNNDYGQIGDFTTVAKSTPLTVPNLTNVKQIITRDNSILVLLNDGTVKGWGYNYHGQLGDNKTKNGYYEPTVMSQLSNISKISLGDNHGIALLNDGTLKTWGNNFSGQLGNGDNFDTSYHVVISGITNIKEVYAGSSNTFVLLNDGTVKAWGDNNYGQLGDGTTTDKYSPITITTLSNVKQLSLGYNHTTAVFNDETAKAWGRNNHGQLGDGTTIDKLLPTPIK